MNIPFQSKMNAENCFLNIFILLYNIRELWNTWFKEKINWGVEKVGGLSNVHNLPFSDFLARSFMIFFSMHKYVWWTTANNFKTYQTTRRRSFWCVMLTGMIRMMERRISYRYFIYPRYYNINQLYIYLLMNSIFYLLNSFSDFHTIFHI